MNRQKGATHLFCCVPIGLIGTQIKLRGLWATILVAPKKDYRNHRTRDQSTMSVTSEDMLTMLEEELEELKKAMEHEYQANKESTLYLELHTRFCQVEAAHDAAKEKYYDDYNHRRKRCIHCGEFEFGATGPCPSKPTGTQDKN